MDYVVIMPSEVLPCPTCRGNSTYHRKLTNNYRCRTCGTIFRTVQNVERLNTPKGGVQDVRMESSGGQGLPSIRQANR